MSSVRCEEDGGGGGGVKSGCTLAIDAWERRRDGFERAKTLDGWRNREARNTRRERDAVAVIRIK